jgi:uncharacterized repeat protein (TIGR01451 family)
VSDGEQEPAGDQEPDAGPPGDSDSEPVLDIRVRIEVSAKTARVGDELLLTVVIINGGEADAVDLNVTLRLSDNGEVLTAQVIDGGDAWTVDMSPAAARGEVLVPIAELPAGHVVEIDLLVQANRSGLLTLAAEIGSGQTVVSEEATELEIGKTFEKQVTIRRPAQLCGVATLPVVITVGLVMALRAATGRRVSRKSVWGA